MEKYNSLLSVLLRFALLPAFFALAGPAAAQLNLGPEELVEAGGVPIDVPGYSVPSLTFWNADSLKDLIVGEGGGGHSEGKVRVYLNVGTENDPQFTDYFYAQSEDSDLVCDAEGCLGCFPRMVYWDSCGRKDLLIGQANGTLRFFLNVGSQDDPSFDAGTLLQVGEPGFKTDIDVGSRATPSVVDWDSDGKKDLVVGARDGKLHVFINEGTIASPDFRSELFAQEDDTALIVPSERSSPHVLDLDDDGRKDILTGNTEGQLLFYSNVGTDEQPMFSGYVHVESDSVPIDLPGSPRSRPFVCDWTDDGLLDVLIGSGDGLVRLYQGVDGGTGIHWDKPPLPIHAARLLAPYPNPFNPSVTIPFVLSASQRVHISAYTMNGRKIAVLADDTFTLGHHKLVWDGVDELGQRLPSGVYFIRLKAGDISSTRKVVLLR